jgi:hypothetical protein
MDAAIKIEVRDDARDHAVVGRLRRLLNEGMLALLAGAGSCAGWLDALASVQPAGGDAVARAAAADEARVRSWLAALVAGRLVEYDGARGTYALEPALGRFLRGDQGRAYQRGLGELAALASTLPRRSAPCDAPPPAELLALAPGLGARVARGAAVLLLGRGADVLGRALADAFPAAPPRVHVAARGGVPRGARARFDVALSVDERGATWSRAARLHAALADGGLAVLAVPALSDNPSDDALHPVGPFLLGARALDASRERDDAGPLPALLAAAGFEVSALARVPSDPFRDYVVVNKPVSPNR